ncbi:MAG: metallopeptidase family protein [Myxococcota bacterium]
MRWQYACALVLAASACQEEQAPATPADTKDIQGARSPLVVSGAEVPTTTSRVAPLAVCRSRGKEPLEAARAYYDDGQFDDALSCAAQSAALYPQEPQAHSERGAALAALGRFDEAQLAYARALALDPDHVDALLGAAHLYAIGLTSSRERDELAVLYAERGLELSEQAKDHELSARFALLSAMAFNDLGHARDALERAELALKWRKGDAEARYERAVALFELCRFQEAKAAFLQILDDPQRTAHAHHHLGLLHEREGKWQRAEKYFAKARELDPEDFPLAQPISIEDFRAEVAMAVANLPEDMKKDLAHIPVTAEELPKDKDLLSGDPPLSPAILGLFRGPPLGEACTPGPGEDSREPCRSVALYRKNLARAVKSREELLEQIRVTLLHEVGHLRGEDDDELAARGLE